MFRCAPLWMLLLAWGSTAVLAASPEPVVVDLAYRAEAPAGVDAAFTWLRGRPCGSQDPLPSELAGEAPLVFADESGSLRFLADQQDGAAYRRLWLDRDGDGVFGPAECMPLPPGAFELPPVEVQVRDGQGHRPVRLVLFNLTRRGRLGVRVACHYAGTARLGGLSRQVLLVDDDGDGRVEEFQPGDDVNGGARLHLVARGEDAARWWWPLAERIGLGGELYRVSFEDAAAGVGAVPPIRLRFTPVESGAGRVVVSGDSPALVSRRTGRSPLPLGPSGGSAPSGAGRHLACGAGVRLLPALVPAAAPSSSRFGTVGSRHLFGRVHGRVHAEASAGDLGGAGRLRGR